MGIFSAKVYDWFMSGTEEACLADWRAEVLADAQGRVLEIGAGTGANIPFYPDGVELRLFEPDSGMLEEMLAKFPTANAVGGTGERLPFEDSIFDAVVSTLVLCSVPEQASSLREIWRVLRPGGAFIFIEHVASDDPVRLKWQRRWDPLWSRAAGGCHTCRDTESAILDAGFRIEHITRQSMRKALPIVRPTIRGIARRD
jgi:ubiquinone/menaquinone biosynthesis C-methylase UbiE